MYIIQITSHNPQFEKRYYRAQRVFEIKIKYKMYLIKFIKRKILRKCIECYENRNNFKYKDVYLSIPRFV